jgi:protein-tyrosine phosphatase
VSSYRICFVCMGNICRSPTAEIVMRARLAEAGLADRVAVDSAGTGSWHAGSPADDRAAETLHANGYDATGHVARQFDASWFAERDLVVALDNKNVQSLKWMAPPGQEHKIVRLRSFDPMSRGGDLDVPDPYYGGAEGFNEVLALVEAACDGLLTHVQAELG